MGSAMTMTTIVPVCYRVDSIVCMTDYVTRIVHHGVLLRQTPVIL